MCDPVFVTLAHQAGSMAVAAVLSELSGVCQRFSMTFYSLCASSWRAVVHRCTYCQKAVTWRRQIVSRAVFLSAKICFREVWYRDIIIFLSWLSGCNLKHCIWKVAGNLFMSTENGISNTWKNWWVVFGFFLKSWKQFSNCFIKTESMAAYFLLFTGLCLGSISQCTQLFAITESALHCTLPVLWF